MATQQAIKIEKSLGYNFKIHLYFYSFLNNNLPQHKTAQQSSSILPSIFLTARALLLIQQRPSGKKHVKHAHKSPLPFRIN